jgi:large subunit ribosomal protein L20
MPRTKTIASRKHKEIRKAARGFRNARSRRIGAAKEALLHAGQYAYIGRRLKKRDLRSLWIVRLNAAARENGMKYSELIKKLKDNKVELDRKILADIAARDPQTFTKILSELK